ncbi:MAG: glucose-6-phosphate isomerase [Elusimicrobiota bacterium]
MSSRQLPQIKLNYTNCFSEYVGNQGINKADLEGLSEKIRQGSQVLLQKTQAGSLGFAGLPEAEEQLAEILKLAGKLRHKFDNLVVIGIGGSALGNIAVQQALRHPYWNLLSSRQRQGWLRIFVVDNIDPQFLAGLKDVINFRRTIFNVISKAGGTTECLANFFVLKEALSKTGKNYLSQIIVTTSEGRGWLREYVQKNKVVSLPVPENVGGRFSVFSAVGLLSAAAAGIDLKKVLAGARLMNSRCQSADLWENPAALYAALQYLFYRRGRNISVMMPYSNALYGFSDWFRQLWAESLGKRLNDRGETVNVGPTPVKALGATDQHSQLQLYMEGPQDKIITFLSVKDFKVKVNLPAEGRKRVGAKGLGELIKAEESASRLALTRNNRPNLTIYLPEISPFTVGQLFQMFEWAVAYAGALLEINAFDQPGVELGKILTRQILGCSENKEEQTKILDEISRTEQSPFTV